MSRGSPDPRLAGARPGFAAAPPGDSELGLTRALLLDATEKLTPEEDTAAASACCRVLHRPYPMPVKVGAPKRLDLQNRRHFIHDGHCMMLT
ncbi:uncharacterized protein N7496_006558 [Penicillium cataractarum]|uniref:Uncharacterized protein n=1 Tax=Penicillium cataractarum TaxID=2100454 RepID=A0A9W9V8R0_9EURO|nr:uncharacterized protein N7496_006558 [Penicillium cataractarum]KAJ5370466.1 hypothetical protein N7496_006558 [Penicillium cataractarum]